MGLLNQKSSNSDTAAVDTATKAAEAGLTVLVMRFNEKMVGDSAASGYAVNAPSTGISAVETTGLWRFESVVVEKDSRTLGDRMAFYAVFRRT
jgi:hypothetical protein